LSNPYANRSGRGRLKSYNHTSRNLKGVDTPQQSLCDGLALVMRARFRTNSHAHFDQALPPVVLPFWQWRSSARLLHGPSSLVRSEF